MPRNEQHGECAIFTNMCMIEDRQGRILVQDRLNPNWPGIAFPGGHVEAGEPFSEAVIREVREETGLTISHPRLCGIKHFQTDEGCRYVVLFYKTRTFSGRIRGSEEGDVFWIAKADLLKYKLAPGFEDMFQVFEDDELSEIYFCMENGEWVEKLL